MIHINCECRSSDNSSHGLQGLSDCIPFYIHQKTTSEASKGVFLEHLSLER